MAGIEELRYDTLEAKSLLALAVRKRFKDLLSIEVNKLESEIAKLEVAEENKSNSTNTLIGNKLYTALIRNYSWDQSEKFMKIYVSLNGIQNICKDNTLCNFTQSGFDLKVNDLDGKNHELKISKFAYTIKPDKSFIKIKTDMIVVFAAKATDSKWEAVTAEEKRTLDAKKKTEPKASTPTAEADPQSGLMDMMKQMYQDGDDEMKRMLNKTWYESQNKKNNVPSSDFMDNV